MKRFCLKKIRNSCCNSYRWNWKSANSIREQNQNLYNLIEEFYKITKVPILLNTSFNENEPIVENPEQAIDCFIRTDMDALVIENILLIKK